MAQNMPEIGLGGPTGCLEGLLALLARLRGAKRPQSLPDAISVKRAQVEACAAWIAGNVMNLDAGDVPVWNAVLRSFDLGRRDIPAVNQALRRLGSRVRV